MSAVIEASHANDVAALEFGEEGRLTLTYGGTGNPIFARRLL